MKTLSRAATFTISLIAGFIAVAIFSPSVIPVTSGPLSFPLKRALTGTVEVHYITWEMREGYPIARFEVVNGLDRPLTYGAFAENAPFPTVKVDGESLNFMHCGTGQQEFRIAPGGTAIFDVAGYYFDRVKPENRVTVGFYFRTTYLGEVRHFTTESFVFPADFLVEAARRR